MKEVLKVLTMLTVLTVGVIIAVESGRRERQTEMEQRALNMAVKDCYTLQEIELIIFGEIQE